MKTIKVHYGLGNTRTKTVPDSTTWSQVINDPSLQAALGYGANVIPLRERRTVNLNDVVQDGDEIVLETVANRKGADIRIKVEYGLANSLEKSFPEGTTVGQVIQDRTIQAELGYGANVRPLIDRVEQPLDAPLENGDTIVLETVANTKGQ